MKINFSIFLYRIKILHKNDLRASVGAYYYDSAKTIFQVPFKFMICLNLKLPNLGSNGPAIIFPYFLYQLSFMKICEVSKCSTRQSGNVQQSIHFKYLISIMQSRCEIQHIEY